MDWTRSRFWGVSKHWAGFSTGMWDWYMGLVYRPGMWDWSIELEYCIGCV